MFDPTRPTPARMASVTAPREQVDQIMVITVLLALAQEDAPSTSWRVREDQVINSTVLPHLEGHMTLGTDQERLNGLAAWQRVTGAGPVEVTPSGNREHHTIRGTYEGLVVEVVTIVDAPAVCCSGCQGHTGGAA